jgi:two-component system sensor histidine kinase YesM
MEDNYRQAAIYGTRNLDSLIEKYNTISKLLYSYNPENSSILRGTGLARILNDTGTGTAEQVRRHNDIIAFLYLIHTSDSYITNVIFAAADGNYYTFGQNNRPFVDAPNFSAAMKINKMSPKPNRLRVIATHHDGYFQKSNNSVFTIERNYIDLSYPLGIDRILGTLYIDVSTRCIDDIFKQLDVYQNGGIAIFDSEDNLVYGNQVYHNNHKNRDLEITGYCENAPWRIVITTDFERSMRNIVNLIRLISVIVVLVLIALLVVSVFYSKLFSRPVRLLLEGMRKMEEGDFKARVKIKAHDEIGQLTDGFYQMAARLEEYIQTSFLAQIRRKEAELSSLKAKIKPHFLYNSLELIRMNAIAHDDGSTAELAFLLAEQMRSSIEPLNETVALSRELDMIRAYFAFIDLRSNHEITWDINRDPSLDDAEVLSLMLQPIVENAVIHGIKPRGRGHIQITAERRGNDLVMRVTDNGVGMDNDTIRKLGIQLQGEFREDDESKDSVGLKNVHDRLRYKYGEAYGLLISVDPGPGVSVTMVLPLIQGEASGV